jgi:hypothetical protein
VHPDGWRWLALACWPDLTGWQKERRRNRRLKSGFDRTAPAGRISIFKAEPARFLLLAGRQYCRHKIKRL